jgi:hypothetical protein
MKENARLRKMSNEATKPVHLRRTIFLGLPKLSARHATWVMPLLLSVIMTCIVSLISTLRSVGLVPGIFHTWLGAWGLSLTIAFPTVILVLPLVRKATSAIVDIA